MPLNKMATNSPSLKLPSLTNLFVWTLSASLFAAACQWGMFVMLAKHGSATLVGRYAFALAVAYPISLLANLNLRVVFVNDLEGRYPFRRMLGAKYLLVAIAAIALLFISFFRRSTWDEKAVLLLIGGALLVDSLSDSYYSILQKYERMDRIARSQLCRSFLAFSLAAIAIFTTGSLLYAACGLLIGRVATLVFYDALDETFQIGRAGSGGTEILPDSARLIEHFSPQWSLKLQFQMLWIALPLGIVAVLVSLNGNMPRYVIEKYLGPRELGIFSALSYIPQAAVLVAGTVGNVAYARVGRMYFLRNIAAFKQLLGKMVLISIGLGVSGLFVSAVAGRRVLTLLYRPEYAAHLDLLLWLVGAATVACVATGIGCAMTAASQFRPQVPLFIVVNAVSAGAALLLVPRLGLIGAALASLLSLLVQLSGAWMILQRALAGRAANSETTPASVIASALISGLD